MASSVRPPASPSTPSAPPEPPARPGEVTQPRLGPIGFARWAWRQLTSMRTALFLLLLVAVAAVPGSIFPQRSVNTTRVNEYLQANPTTGPWLDRIGMFEVYSSPWFSAIYLLLMVSLIGCVVPRTRLHLHALRGAPPAAPRRLARLTEHRVVETAGDVDTVTAAIASGLRRRRYRLRADSGPGVVAAETGYLRETGNLVFHIALLGMTAALAFGYFYGYRGDKIVPVGDTFANTAGTYSWSQGPLVDPGSLTPFTVRIDDLKVAFEERAGGAQLGAPRDFRANVTVTPQPGAASYPAQLSVNGPLTFGNAAVYLLGNGYAPVITVRDRHGDVLYHEATPFLPQDNVYTSAGAVKVVAAQPEQLAFTGYLFPTAVTDGGGVRSIFPDARHPVLMLDAYRGRVFDQGRPESVYTIDTGRLTPITENGKKIRISLTPGQTFTAPDGSWSITFDEMRRWAGVSTRYDPAKPFALASALLMVLGLTASLLVRRRRVFARVTPAGAGRVQVEYGALAKSEDALLGEWLDRFGAQVTPSVADGSPSPALSAATSSPPAPSASASSTDSGTRVGSSDSTGRP